jgi:hypothetical protein
MYYIPVTSVGVKFAEEAEKGCEERPRGRYEVVA